MEEVDVAAAAAAALHSQVTKTNNLPSIKSRKRKQKLLGLRLFYFSFFTI
jgi:hypothetical protein